MTASDYINFPITLLQNVFIQEDKSQFLCSVLSFLRYKECIEYSTKYSIGSPSEIYPGDFETKIMSEYLNVNKLEFLPIADAKNLYDIHCNTVLNIGITKTMFSEFLIQYKTEFEWKCLIAFLAFKSIIGNKDIVKTDNTLLLARIAGFTSKKDFLENSTFKLNRYQLDKLKSELQMNWGLIYYSYYNRGFYFGFSHKLTIEDLIFFVEQKRLKSKATELNQNKASLRASVIKMLNNNQGSHLLNND